MTLQSTEEYITGQEAVKKIGAPGEGIRRPKRMARYTVYVQSIGSGARHLGPGSSVLYEVRCMHFSRWVCFTDMIIYRNRHLSMSWNLSFLLIH